MQGDSLLPHMITANRTQSKSSSSRHAEVSFGFVRPFELCVLPALTKDISTLITNCTYNGERLNIQANNEAEVESHVMIMFRDILKALRLYHILGVHQQASFDTHERGDLYLITVFGIVVLTVEVKRESKKHDEISHRKCLGQLFNYMHSNRECSSLSYCFGVWTTYNQCRIIWLNDPAHNQLATAREVNVENKFPLPPDEYNWGLRHVCASKVYERHDNIPMVMACLVWKLFNSQLQAKTVITRTVSAITSRKFRAVDKDGYFFKADREVIKKMTFKMASCNTKIFYLLLQHNGRDGKAWIVSNSSGCLTVVKFRRCAGTFKFSMFLREGENEEDGPYKDDGGDDNYGNDLMKSSVSSSESNSTNKDLVMSELQAWIHIYSRFDVRPFMTMLAGRDALVMPFAFCFSEDGQLSMNLKSYLPCDELFEEGMEHWSNIKVELLKNQNKAVELLFAAVKHIASCGYYHNDIKWQHLALLPVYNHQSGFDHLQPILVDLAEVSSQDPVFCLQHMKQYIVDDLLYENHQQQKEFEKLYDERFML